LPPNLRTLLKPVKISQKPYIASSSLYTRSFITDIYSKMTLTRSDAPASSYFALPNLSLGLSLFGAKIRPAEGRMKSPKSPGMHRLGRSAAKGGHRQPPQPAKSAQQQRDDSAAVAEGPECTVKAPINDAPSSAAAAARKVAIGTIGSGVEIRPSAIPQAGNGLFASRPYARGELITEVRRGPLASTLCLPA
jgi:hypothetical protein